MQLLVNGAQFSAASGAHVAMGEGKPFRAQPAQGRLDASTAGIETRGGGLPEATLHGSRRGQMAASPAGWCWPIIGAGNARLGLTPVSVLRTGDGALRVNTTVSLDGPIGDGAVTGFEAPLDISVTAGGALRLPRDCTPVRWRTLPHRHGLARSGTAGSFAALGGSTARIASVAPARPDR